MPDLDNDGIIDPLPDSGPPVGDPPEDFEYDGVSPGPGGGGAPGGGAPPPPPPTATGPDGSPIWDPVGYEPDPMNFDTISPDPGEVPDVDYYGGDGGPLLETGEVGTEGEFASINPDGSINPGDVNPTTREVTPDELVENRLSGLLNSDSKFIQDARRQGLEQANAMGGLGGTAGTGASMNAALRTAMPIAQSDAEAFRLAASENMAALNQYSQLNAQRATQLELAQIDASSRQKLTQITTSAGMAAARLQSATQRDLSRLDSETRLRITEMNGKIQDRLADSQFRYTALLNDQMGAIQLGLAQVGGEYGLAGEGLGGQYGLANTEIQAEVAAQQLALQRETNYLNIATSAHDGYLQRIENLNGVEMDDAARSAAIASIESTYRATMTFINSLFPEQTPIEF